MTGAEAFSQILARIEHVVAGYHEDRRIGATIEMLGGAAIGAAAFAFEHHNYAEGSDIIVMAHRMIQELGTRMMKERPEAADLMSRMAQRFCGSDVALDPSGDPPSDHVNALSAAELEALGLDPEPHTLADMIDEKLDVADDLGDHEQYQFHELPRTSIYEPLHIRCARHGADGIECTTVAHVNICMMRVGPIVRHLCSVHAERECAWAYPDEEYVMHDSPDHVQFNRRRKPRATR